MRLRTARARRSASRRALARRGRPGCRRARPRRARRRRSPRGRAWRRSRARRTESPSLPATEETLMMRPLRCSRMAGRTACVTASVPKTLTSNWARHCVERDLFDGPVLRIAGVVDEDVEAAGAVRAPPRPPRRWSPASVTSSGSRPSGRPAASAARSSFLRAVAKTRCPRAARASAEARPMPDEQPVTRITAFSATPGCYPLDGGAEATQTGNAGSRGPADRGGQVHPGEPVTPVNPADGRSSIACARPCDDSAPDTAAGRRSPADPGDPRGQRRALRALRPDLPAEDHARSPTGFCATRGRRTAPRRRASCGRTRAWASSAKARPSRPG